MQKVCSVLTTTKTSTSFFPLLECLTIPCKQYKDRWPFNPSSHVALSHAIVDRLRRLWAGFVPASLRGPQGHIIYALSSNENGAYLEMRLKHMFSPLSDVSLKFRTLVSSHLVWSLVRSFSFSFPTYIAAQCLAPGPKCIIFPFSWSFASSLPLCCESDSLPELRSLGAV